MALQRTTAELGGESLKEANEPDSELGGLRTTFAEYGDAEGRQTTTFSTRTATNSLLLSSLSLLFSTENPVALSLSVSSVKSVTKCTS